MKLFLLVNYVQDKSYNYVIIYILIFAFVQSLLQTDIGVQQGFSFRPAASVEHKLQCRIYWEMSPGEKSCEIFQVKRDSFIIQDVARCRYFIRNMVLRSGVLVRAEDSSSGKVQISCR